MNVVVVNQGSEQRVVECQPDRSASVHRCIGTLRQQACKLFAPVHKAKQAAKQQCGVVISTGLKNQLSCCVHDNLETVQLESQDGGQCRISVSRASSILVQRQETGKLYKIS